ncbi:MAG: SoxR reducing system RseC family protein [Halioglobus sp.]|nr:SoxR reducing system RseC family protein [Halioglobus sp.]
MLTEVGRVVALEADSLWVETIRKSTCGSCAAQKGCGHGLLNRLYDGRRGLIRVLPGEIALDTCRVHDEVRISIPEEVILRGSIIAYIMPLVCMLAGAVLAVQGFSGNEDVLAAVGALGGLLLGFGLLRWHALRHHSDAGFQPVLIEILRPLGEPVSLT